MKIGKYKISVLETGTFGLDGGAMFGIIPKPLWNKSTPADEKNRIKLGAKVLLLESASKKILIDTGMGNNWSEKLQTIYDINQSENSLPKSLKKKNISPGEITDVIITHLHFDHVGGAVIEDNGKIVPAFPNAKYFVQHKQYKWATNPSDKDRGSFIKQNFLPLYEEGVLNFIDGEEHFDNEIILIPLDGHTFSQQMVKISDGENTFLHCGDLIPTSSHVPLPYIMGYDINPLISIKEKKEWLEKAVQENWKIIFEHDPEYICGTIKKTEKGFSIKERFKVLENEK